MRRRKAHRAQAAGQTKVPRQQVWRSAHGNAEATGQTKVAEPCADGVRPVPDGATETPAPRNNGRFTSASGRQARRRRQELEKLPDFAARSAPWLPPSEALAPFDGARQDLLRQRRDEIHTLTGGVDSGVGAQLRAWAYIHAAGEYWASQFFASGDPQAFQRMVSAFKAASTEDAKLRDAAAWAAEARPQDPRVKHDFIALAEGATDD